MAADVTCNIYASDWLTTCFDVRVMATLRCLEKCQGCALKWKLFLNVRETKIVKNDMLDVRLLCLIHLCLACGCNTMILCVFGNIYAVTHSFANEITPHMCCGLCAWHDLISIWICISYVRLHRIPIPIATWNSQPRSILQQSIKSIVSLKVPLGHVLVQSYMKTRIWNWWELHLYDDEFNIEIYLVKTCIWKVWTHADPSLRTTLWELMLVCWMCLYLC